MGGRWRGRGTEASDGQGGCCGKGGAEASRRGAAAGRCARGEGEVRERRGRTFQPKGSQSGLPTGWKKVKTSVAPPEATESSRRLRISGSRNAVPASANATCPKTSETESLSSGTRVVVSHRRMGVTAAAPLVAVEVVPAAEESVVHARRPPEARGRAAAATSGRNCGTSGRNRNSGTHGGRSRDCSTAGCARRRSIVQSGVEAATTQQQQNGLS